ncbi:hypothetical protein B0H19DRAFT_1251526 [Mycena capillaripes]|nr:hypothetical protein B0H19DRAFT_1251526 [Mycena capillaripes]
MAPAARSRTSSKASEPYAHSPTPAARRLDGTLVGRLNALRAEDRALPCFNINVTERDRPKIAFCYTAEQLFYMQPAGQPNFDACVDCNLPVAFCGWQGYHLDKVTGHLVASGHRCKACIQYSLMNRSGTARSSQRKVLQLDGLPGSPNRLRVSFPTMTLALPGVKRIQEYRDAVADLDTTPEECEAVERRLEEARDLSYTYPQTPLADFKWPSPTPPRVFRPKIPPGHPYDYHAAGRRRMAEEVADPVAEAFYSYNK